MRMPRGWREGLEGEAVCPHRDLSVCRVCEEEHAERVVNVFGKFYWASDVEDVAYLRKLAAR